MKRNLAILCLLLSTFYNQSSIAQTPLITAINENLIPIETIQPTDNFAQFDQFKKVLSTTKILAMGEVTHGIKEFTDFRITMIKQLIVKSNYKSIVLEADFSGVTYMNDYICYGKGDKLKALNNMRIGVYRNKEFLEFFDWLKAYNQQQPLENRVKIFGSDMQMTMMAVNLINGSAKLKKEFSPEAKKGLQTLFGLGEKASNEQKLLLQQLVREIKDEMVQHTDTSTFKRSLETVLQSIDFYLAGDWYKRAKVRDKAMADNISWILEKEKQRMILLAHNTHIAKNPVYDDIRRAGSFLKEKYKDAYYSLGFSFFSGEFEASDRKVFKTKVYTMPEIKNKQSSEYIFSQVELPNFILDFNSASKNAAIKDFLNTKTYSKNIGAGYVDSNKDVKPAYMPLISKFDGIAFFRKSTALTFIP